ncbi:MAG: hypothetical protein AAFN93_04400 [Bacteroidota bacterium]
MKQFVAENPDIEVNGSTVLSVVDGMGAIKNIALRILWENGIEVPKANQWYSQQRWLDCFKELSCNVGPNTLFGIGLAIPDNAIFPEDIDSIQKALESIDVAYHMNHRLHEKILYDSLSGEKLVGIGNYKYEETGQYSANIICDNPYPCEFDKGIITTMARRFRPKGAKLIIKHRDELGCRKHGHDSCTYTVTWEPDGKS